MVVGCGGGGGGGGDHSLALRLCRPGAPFQIFLLRGGVSDGLASEASLICFGVRGGGGGL